MQIYHRAKKFDGIQFESSSKENILPDNKRELWIKLDAGLIKIENEWKKRIMTEQYLSEFTPKSFRIINDVDDFTVIELKYWYKLLNLKFEDKSKNIDLYFKKISILQFSEIHIIYWFWKYNNEKLTLTDIYFKIGNNSNSDIEEYGAIFLDDDIVLINNTGSLSKTKNTSIDLEKRIFSLELIRK
jgi:hypothetical protein